MGPLNDEQPRSLLRNHDPYQMEDLQLYRHLPNFENLRSEHRKTIVHSTTAALQPRGGLPFLADFRCRCRHETSCPQTHQQHTAYLYPQSWIIRRHMGHRQVYSPGGREVWISPDQRQICIILPCKYIRGSGLSQLSEHILSTSHDRQTTFSRGIS